MSRVFNLEEAKALMPEVKRLTEPVYMLAGSLAEELQDAEDAQDSALQDALKERLQALIESWSASIQDLDAEVKGLWLVDFDSGDGYWCWAYPEDQLDHWHSYEGGFGSRMLITEKPVKA